MSRVRCADRGRKRYWDVLLYATVSIALCLCAFHGVLSGKTLSAPLDIAPALFSQYTFVNPKEADDGVPENHYIIDQLTYDLPLQYTIYESYRGGHIPWWDPYMLGGRPLLADAHVNGTDPVRLVLYLCLPFVHAYNWTLIAHIWLSGFGVFLLVRRHVGSGFIAGTIGLAAQFCGCQALYIGHPWIAASMWYYPYLWLIWHTAWSSKRIAYWTWAASTCLIAGILYSGNIQSHVYLVMFSASFVFGYGWCDRHLDWRRVILPVATGLFLGTLMAAPVLVPQIELFLLNHRTLSSSHSGFIHNLGGLLSVTAPFPWVLGTYRTLDLGKLFHVCAPGFHLFAGPVVVILGVAEMIHVIGHRKASGTQRTALLLVVGYLLVACTPLRKYLYLRCAWMGVLGLCLLAGFAVRRLLLAKVSMRRWGITILVIALLLAAGIHIGALIVYPRMRPAVETFVQSHSVDKRYFGDAEKLRSAQIDRLPQEVTFANPQAFSAWCAMLLIGLACLDHAGRRRTGLLYTSLGISLVPVFLFFQAFVPSHPRDTWEILLRGGGAQHRLHKTLQPGGRLWDKTPRLYNDLFPHAFGHLYGIRSVNGYAALRPLALAMILQEGNENLPINYVADAVYIAGQHDRNAGTINRITTNAYARCFWTSPVIRDLALEEQPSPNQVVLHVGPGKEAPLLWTDTYYPGWQATFRDQPIQIQHQPPCFSRLMIPAGRGELILCYRPRFLSLAIGASLCSVLCVVLLLAGKQRVALTVGLKE